MYWQIRNRREEMTENIKTYHSDVLGRVTIPDAEPEENTVKINLEERIEDLFFESWREESLIPKLLGILKEIAPVKARKVREGEDEYLFRYLEEDIDVIDPYGLIFPSHIGREDYVEIVEPCGMHCCGFRRLGLESEAKELVLRLIKLITAKEG
jgi:hypothetical protein